jgi:hypothetical protein
MNIDINKVNLAEKDIENWLFENPHELGVGYMGEYMVERWIARQYPLPSGIADLVGISGHGLVVVVEVKNVPISKAAVLQVCRYANDLDDISGNRSGYYTLDSNLRRGISRILIGPSIDDQTFNEAMAVGVEVIAFGVEMNLTLGRYTVDDDAWARREDMIDAISLRAEWDCLGAHYSDRSAPPPDTEASEIIDAVESDLLGEDSDNG